MTPQQEPIILGGAGQSQKNRWQKFLDWFSKNRNSIITLIVVIAVIAGAIYLSQRSQVGEEEQIEQPAAEEETISEKEEPEKQAFEAVKEGEKVKEERKITDKDIIEKAIKGDGITHLSRKALAAYLQENPELAKDLTKEHKIYIEDYLKDAKVAEFGGKTVLQIGEEVSFSKDLIKQAIDSSKKLSEKQLKQIQIKYSPLVKSL